MVRAGEASGAMEVILNRLASFMEKAAQIAAESTKLRGAIASIPTFGEDIHG